VTKENNGKGSMFYRIKSRFADSSVNVGTHDTTFPVPRRVYWQTVSHKGSRIAMDVGLPSFHFE
jgi:hypothetical protein